MELIRLDEYAYGIVTKTVHKTLPVGGRAQGVGRIYSNFGLVLIVNQMELNKTRWSCPWNSDQNCTQNCQGVVGTKGVGWVGGGRRIDSNFGLVLNVNQMTKGLGGWRRGWWGQWGGGWDLGVTGG